MSSYPKCKHGIGDGDANNVVECKDCIIDEQAEQIRQLENKNATLKANCTVAVTAYRITESENQRLKEALQELYDEQNGPPLLRDAKSWQAAMDKAEVLLAAQPQKGE